MAFTPKVARPILVEGDKSKAGPFSVERTIKAPEKLNQANLSSRLVNKNQRLSWLDKKLNHKTGEKKPDSKMQNYAIN